MGANAPPELIFDARDAEADAATVNALARLQLLAKRSGGRMRLRNASADLLDLVAFMGLADVLPEER
jgi:ABC-type transporter Mla MlaB component